MRRAPAVAGQFYKGSPDTLQKQVAGFIQPDALKRKAIGIVSPHAGFMYSGAIAGAVYSSIELPQTFILIGPNHTGLGAPLSLMAQGTWETPLGPVDIDEDLAGSILTSSSHVHDDSLAHLREHSLEVQLPFIQHFRKDFKIVPIQMLDTRYTACVELGRTIAKAVKSWKGSDESREVVIIASSDMSHYETAAVAKDHDFKAIQQILSLDPEGLYKAVRNYGITMCGYGPVIAMMLAAKELGATRAELIKYANSGDVSGDYHQVVGYAGLVIM